MSEDEWEVNKSCRAKNREHKFYWKNDPATGLPSDTIGKCAHCGLEMELNRHSGLPGHNDKEQE